MWPLLSLAAAAAADSKQQPAALQAGPPATSSPRILAAVTTSCGMPPEQLHTMIKGLESRCSRTPTLAVVFNVYNTPIAPNVAPDDYAVQGKLGTETNVSAMCANATLAAVPALPACVIGTTRVRGYKMLFLKHALTPAVTAPYDFIWSFDNDMDVNPRTPFDLLGATRAMAASRVALAQPLVTGAAHQQRGAPHLTPSKAVSHIRRLRHTMSLSGTDFATLSLERGGQLSPDGCLAQSVTFVESQTPIFSRDAWRVFYDRLLSRLNDTMYAQTDQGLDSIWCHMMARELPDRPACAVLSTPVHDADFGTIVGPYGHRLPVRTADAMEYVLSNFSQYADICAGHAHSRCATELQAASLRGVCLAFPRDLAYDAWHREPSMR